MCAGLIGYRALCMCGEAQRIGLYGFGAAAHILCQVGAHRGRRCMRSPGPATSRRSTSRVKLGAVWAGGSDTAAPELLDAAIIFAPDGALVPLALARAAPAGTVVCAGIHMSDIPSFPYSSLWQERVLRSVANLTRRDGKEFLRVAPEVPVHTHVSTYRLEDVGQALDDLRVGRFSGAAVVVP